MNGRAQGQCGAMVEPLEQRRMLTADLKFALALGATQNAVTSDLQGNSYVVGRFTGTVDFNTSSRRVYAMTAKNAGGDMFVAKYGSQGQFLWGVQFGDATNSPTGAAAIAPRTSQFRVNTIRNKQFPLDVTGSTLWITGTFSGSLDVDPHPRRTATITATGASDAFLIGLDQDGILRAGGAVTEPGAQTAVALSIAPTSSGFAGYIDVVANSDDGSGVISVITPHYGAKGQFDGTGFVSAAGIDVTATGVASDRSGNRFITGFIAGASTFGAGPRMVITGPSAYLAKFDGPGNLTWISQIDNATISGIVTDDASRAAPNGFAISGSFSGSTNVQLNPDPDEPVGVLTSAGGLDAFVARYDADGTLQYGYRMGGTGDDAANTVGIDGTGAVYIGGQFQGSATFGRLATPLVSRGGLDGFASKYGPTGRNVYAVQVGGAGDDLIAHLTLGQGGDLIATGPLIAPGNYDPFGRRILQPAAGHVEDLFLIDLD